MIYQIQRDKCFPLPTYDLDTINRVKVTVYGKILDKNYTQLLHANGSLDIQTVFLLDQVQKRNIISKENYGMLKKHGLVEGRYPNVYVSFKIAEAVGQKTRYIGDKGLDEALCKSLILAALKVGPLTKQELLEVLDRGALSAVLDDAQKSRKVSNLLQKMKQEGTIVPLGTRRHAKWALTK